MSCKLIEVIECTELRRGDGKDNRSPVRVVTQYFATDGTLLAEVDPCAQTIPVEDEMTERCSVDEHRQNQARISRERMMAEYGVAANQALATAQTGSADKP